jgi:hypothetical protein
MTRHHLKVSIDTVARFERGDELKERTIDALQRTLEVVGVEFTNGGQPGVRSRGLLPCALQNPPERPERRLPRKQSAAELPMRQRKSDSLPAWRKT